MKVIDVSEHNGVIDYYDAKKDGIEGVIIRAGYGKGNVDKKFTTNINGAMQAGLHIGIYWFSYAYTEKMAKREAEYVNDIIMPYKPYLDMPVFFDWEYDSMKFAKKNGAEVGKNEITNMTKAFCEEITALGYDAGYYLNLDYSKRFYDEDILTEYKRWFARYTKAEQKDCYLWQYSSSGKVAGINGNVDMDELWGDLSTEKPSVSNSSGKTEKPSDKPQTSSEKYVVGKTYTINVSSSLNVRKGAGLGYNKVGYDNLTPDAKKHAIGSALKSGTKVTCLQIQKNGNDIWMKIPSGWICAETNGKTYVK